MRVPEANAPETQPEIDLIHHQMNQPQSFGDFAHGNYISHDGRKTKLTCCPSPTTTTGARGPRFHTTGDEVSYARDLVARKLEEAQVVPPFHTTTTTPTTTSIRKDDKPTVYYRRQWNPCHMDFDLVPASH